MALTDEAILKIRDLIQSDQLAPGSRLPPEQQLSAQLGLSRSSLREAVKALELARVVDVRRGDGTYVTSLAPRVLLEGFGFAVDLLRDDSLPQIMEVRRLLEPAATALAALRITDDALEELAGLLTRMRAAADDAEQLIGYDTAFHRTVAAATGNESLTSLLDGLSSRTLRARLWRGMISGDVSGQTIAEHEAIYRALRSRDQFLAQAVALIHVDTSESWLRTLLSRADERRPA
ncbi:FadR/GntR family transcriptional regulator [Actinoplanes oblitus]|uniref:FadR/GntR family transcriptional regulator n=1 Tax=Actinoplanes oblitus TaxID=3040509 RepID=A0ABY8W4Q5_9ACTN|nr:FadR/GntR family transcriptional regulator [Actinoplanes oblitus]WIM92841.1 FadR/GntR family transcriptional regulator [Actinoplanes oblitus]